MSSGSLAGRLATSTDAIWLGLLIGVALVAWEFLRPGSVLPGLAGACIVIVCGLRLGPLPALWMTVGAASCVAGPAVRRPWWGLVAGVIASVIAASEAQVGTAAAAAAAVVLAGLNFLMRVAVRARSNKRAR
ncbi:MAG TPA: hypothetical protein VES20_00735 [Bryobacteraceae bacterium]|nr:hypothetical protein [Bryobacteraceae bacterium]